MATRSANDEQFIALWKEFMEVRAFFSSDFKPKTGLEISISWTVHAKLKIAPLIRRLDSDEVRVALGKMQQFAALGECFAYLYWISKVTGTLSAPFRNYADHYLTNAVFLFENRTHNKFPQHKKQTQIWRVKVKRLRRLIKCLDMPINVKKP